MQIDLPELEDQQRAQALFQQDMDQIIFPQQIPE
jgi:hypothetical protein